MNESDSGQIIFICPHLMLALMKHIASNFAVCHYRLQRVATVYIVCSRLSLCVFRSTAKCVLNCTHKQSMSGTPCAHFIYILHFYELRLHSKNKTKQ